MKRLHTILLFATALIAFSPVVSAQGTYSIAGQIKDPKTGAQLEWPKDNGVHQATDFAYSKDISSPLSNGTYWIKLESFSTGSATKIEAAAPADIVLVLDLSSSMVNNNVYKKAETPSGGWTYSNINSGGPYYVLYNNNYYQVERGVNNNRRYLRFRTSGWGNNYRYLSGNSTSSSQPTGTYNDNTPIYTGTLYTSQGTRLDALKRATTAFIDVIDTNDKYEEDGVTERESGRLGNRISIITFWSDSTLVTSLDKGTLADVSDAHHSTAAELKALVNAFENGTGTRPDLGITAANNQFAKYVDEARKLTASRTVVVFTDGEPYPNNNNANYTSAIAAASVSKKTHDATVFTVGLFTTTPGETSNLYKFMNLMSSNAPDAESFNDTDYDFSLGFYKDASAANADLTAVFTEIANQSGGTTTSLSAASSNVDVVSNSFVLPDEVNTQGIENVVKIFVAKLEKIQNGEYKFYEEILVGHLPDEPRNTITGYYYTPLNNQGVIIDPEDLRKADYNISISLEGTNKIKVTGFDYSSMFCGPVYENGYEPTGTAEDESHIDHYQGYKIIIMIPIQMNPDTVGGPDVKTNGPGSGIFISNESTSAFVAYESPTVSLPVNIHITKTGLDAGESAKFRIERALLPKDGPVVYDNLTWHYVSTVFVTRPQGSSDTDPAPVVKVRGMPANADVPGEGGVTEHRNYVYRVSEEPWSWSYDYLTTPKYTDTDYMDNPIEFSNSKKDNIDVKVRHAESKATNIFKPGVVTGNVKFDDSKTNTRPSQSK